MARLYLLLLLTAPFLGASPAGAVHRVARGDLMLDDVQELAPGLSEKLAGYLSAREAAPLGFSPQGQLLIATRFGDVDQLHIVERPGGERRQLTFLREPITQAAFSPDPGRSAFVYLKDTAGNENSQLYYQRLGEPAARLLTDGKSLNGGPVWSNAGREVAFFSTARDAATCDIDIVEPESGALPRLAVTGDRGAWYPLDWSPDDRKLLVLNTLSTSEAYLYVVDLSSGQKREVEPSPAKSAISGAKFSRDGTGVYFISNRDAEFAQLRYVNLFSGERAVVSSHIPWDVEGLALSRDGHYLAYVSNEAGAGKLNLLDLRSHQELIPPRLSPDGTIGSLSFDAAGSRLAFGFAAPNRPRDAYVLDVASNHLEAWTHSEAGAVDSAKFVTPRLTQYPTFDRKDGRQRQIPVYVYDPPTPGTHPLLIALHGGADTQYRPGFDPWLQFAVNELGFAVVAPNVRGSSGYGKSYAALDRGALREDAVKDVGALLVWLGLQSQYDAKHIVVSGDSYGGYLTLATMVDFSERLRGGVELAGITDLVDYLTSTLPYRQTARRAEYGDERDPDMRTFLRRVSPLTNAERISKPLLVAHGANDPQVSVNEAEHLVNRVRSKGLEVWSVQAGDEGHGLAKQQNRGAYYAAFAQFLINASR